MGPLTEEERRVDAYLQERGKKTLPLWSELPDIDLYMDQLTSLVNRYMGYTTKERMLTASMVNNYVKMKVMPAPVKKKYGREHLMYLIVICILKQVMPLSSVEVVLRDALERTTPGQFYESVRLLYQAAFKEAVDVAEYMIEQGNMSVSMTLALALKAHAEQALAQEILELCP